MTLVTRSAYAGMSQFVRSKVTRLTQPSRYNRVTGHTSRDGMTDYFFAPVHSSSRSTGQVLITRSGSRPRSSARSQP